MYINNNFYSNTLLSGSNDKDTIVNGSSYVALSSNSYSKVTIDAKGGNDSIFSDVSGYFRTGSKNKIDGGSGDDTIDNDGNEATVTGGTGNDSIINYGATVRIDAGEGNDNITNKGTSYDPVDHVTIIGGTGNDSIYNAGNTVSVDAGAGNDSIYNEGNNAIILGGNDKDTIWNKSGKNITIDSGAGDDTIENNYYGENVSINSGAGNDSVWNDDSKVTIQAGEGNDTIRNFSHASNVLINSGNGNDYINNSLGAQATINAGDGNDSVYNDHADKVSINLGAGNDYLDNEYGRTSKIEGGDGSDTIRNVASYTTVNAGSGNDSVYNGGQEALVNTGAGNDKIRDYGSNDTIIGDAGNDSITLVDGAVNHLIIYKAGDGNDTIGGFDSTSTLSVVGGNFSVARSGNDAIITVGDGKITLRGAATLDAVNINDKKVLFVGGTYSNRQSNILIIGNDSANTIENSGNNVTIQVLGGNDSINNTGDSVKINGGAGNDSIHNAPTGYYATINGGVGDDSIKNFGSNLTISGGAGNDSIWNDWNSSNNAPYADNDGSNVLFVYNAGDGNDVIKGFKANSTLNLAGTGYISTKSGNDVILTVSDGKITLSGAANLSKINIVETPLNIANSKSNISVIGTGANDTIKNTGEKVVVVAKGGNDSINNGGKNSTVDASDGNDIISNNGANSSLSGGSGSDTIANSSDNVTINAGSGNDSLSIGKASGNLIQYQNGDGDDVITSFSEKSSISVGGAAYASAKLGDNAYVKVGDGLITIRGGADLAKLNVIGTLDKSKNFNNNKDNTLVIGNEQDNNITNTGKNTTILANSGKDSVYNTGANAKIYGGDGNDTLRNFQANSVLIDGSNGDDSIYDKSWYSTISAGSGSDTILIEGASVSANGGTGNDSIKNAGDSNITLAGGKGNDTISNGGAKTIFKYELGDGDDVIEGFRADSTLDISEANYATEKSGNDWLVYVGDGNEITLKGAGNLSKINVRGMEEKAKNLKNTKDNTSMVGSNYADTLDNTGKNVTIMGNAGDDSIKSTGANSSIDGSRGNDKIENGGASSIVEGGLGNDSIYNNRGDKSLVEGGAGNDTITNQARNATVLGGEGNDIFHNSNYGENSILDGGAGNDTIRNTVAQVSISGGAGNDSIDNTDKQHDNSKVTINAGTGNDYINNDSQNILFQYQNGDGFDLIDGFNETSTLSVNGGVKDDSSLSVLGGTQATTTKSGDNIIVTVGEGRVTLSGAAKLSKVNVVETPMNFSNSRSNVTINATNANDTITNSGEKVAIFALGGKDSIINNNQGVNSTITGGTGDDYISNNAKNVTITSESGKNDIRNEAASVSIAGGADSDSIFNHGEEVTVAGGAGADIIENYSGSDKSQIDGGAGDDSIDNAGHNATIQGGAGLDTITNNSGTAVLLDGGAGNDIISIKGAYQNTISGGAGDDTIQLDWSSNNALIVYDNGDGTTVNPGDGNDLIQGFNATSTLQLGGGSSTYSTVKSGDDIIVNVGIDKITLEGAANLSEVHIAGRTKLNLNNTQSAVEILGSNLNDSVRNEGFYVTIKAYGGHDTIRNYAREAVIDVGKGEDFIENRNANSVTITAGAEDDVIVSRGGYRNTINAGTGNDTIDVSGNDEDFIRYKVGDGNDYIIGFNESSSLRIAGEVFSTSRSNQDVIVTVGDDKITLEGAATLSHLNILGVEDVHLNITNRTDNTLLVGTIFNDTISNLGNNVSILARDGDDSIKNGQQNEGCINVTIDTGKGNDTIINENGDTVSIDAGEGNDYIENRNEALTVKAGDGDDKIFNRYSGINSIIDAGAGNDSIDNRASNTTISGGAGNDTIYNNWDIKNGVALSDDNDDGSNVLFNYHTGDGNDVIYGFKNNSTLSIDDIEGAYSTSISGNDIIVTVGDSNVTLKNAANLRRINIVGVTPVNINNSTDDTLIIGTKANDTIWNKGGENVTIQALGGNDTINNYRGNVTIDAGAGNDTIRNSGSSVMVEGGADNDNIQNSGNNVTISGGEGSDSIYNDSFISAISIAGGAGNDSIRNLGSNTTIEGGEGNDTIQNENNNVTINGGVGNDLINNSKENVLFTYANGDGNDIINGFNANSTLSISSGTYTSQVSGSDIIVTVGDGKITLKGAATLSKVNISCEEDKTLNISNSANGTLIVGTDKNDSIANTGDSVTIAGGKGNDTLWNDVGGAPSGGEQVSLNGGAGNDFISNDGDSSTVQGGADNDTVQNWGVKSSLAGGAGNDSIRNYSDSVTIAGGAGNDTLWNEVSGTPAGGKQVSLNGGAGNDFLTSDGANATLIGGADNDTVQNWGANSTISGGAGSDSIWNDGTNVSINAGAGNDTISLISSAANNLIQFRAGDGSDLITGFNATSTLSISGAGYSSEKSGNDIIITVGDDKITLQGAANLSKVNIAGEKLPLTISNSTSNISIVGTDKDDSIKSTGANVTIQALGGNDEIDNRNSNVTIDGGAGNDFIWNDGANATLIGGVDNDTIQNWGANSTISGGEGNDRLHNEGDSVTIAGGAGVDSIWNSAKNVTIEGGEGDDSIRNVSGSSITIDAGAGNDSIYNYYGKNITITGGVGDDSIVNEGNNVLFKYTSGDGNDSIVGFKADSTLSISGAGYSTTKSGNDIIITVGDENITLSGAANLSTVNIAGEELPLTISNRTSNISIVGTDKDDTIENSWETSNVTIQANGGDDSIDNYGSNVLIEAGDGNDIIDNEDYSTGNILINAGAGNDSIRNWSDETTINAGEGNDTIHNWGEYRNVSVDAGAGNDYIDTRNYGVSITGGKGDDTIYNDWNFTNNAPNVPSDYDDDDGNYVQFNYTAGDGNDVIYGFNETDTLNISGGSYFTTKSGNDIIVTVGKENITLSGAATLSTVNIAGSQGINVDKNYSNSQNNVLIVGNDSPNSISNSGNNVTILTKGGNDSIQNWSSNTTIDAGAGNDYIVYNGASISVNGGEGNDNITSYGTSISVNGGEGNDNIASYGASISVNGGEGNDNIASYGNDSTINGGAGNDSISNRSGSNVLFNYTSGDGNDTISGFNTTSTLSISGGAYSTTKNGSDIIVTVGDGKITLTGAANLSKVNIAGSQGINVDKNYSNSQNNVLIVGNDSPNSISNSGNNVTILTKGGNDSIRNWGSNTTIDSGAGNDSIYTNNGSNMIVNGGDGKDKIINYAYKTTVNGGAGDDSISNYRNNTTISGGTGKDSIYISWNFRDNRPYDSDTSNNILINYTAGDGNDIINGFRADSTLSIAGGRYYSQKSGNDIIVTVGKENITLTGAATLSKVNIAGSQGIDVDDSVENIQSNILIVGNDSANTIANTGANVTIQALGGNDSISNTGASVSIDGGDNDDIIRNYVSNVTISGGADNDSIFNYRDGTNSAIFSGEGNDSIANGQAQATLNGEAGNDYIYNDGNKVTIDAGSGNDTIQNNGISGYGENVLIIYNAGDGNDLIRDFRSNSTLSIAGGRYYSTTSGKDIIIHVGKENITLTGAASLSKVNIAGSQGIDVDDSLNNTLSNILIVGNDLDNTIANSGKNVTIQANGGDDSISNTGTITSVDAGAGDDSISNPNKGGNSTVLGGADNDSIYNAGSNVTISGGTGDDSVYNNWDFNKNAPFADNDGSNVVFVYNNGDGNDIINGFRADSTLSIAGSRYYSQKSGNDIIVTVGKENITLTGAASLSKVNIAGSQGIDVDDSLNNTLSNILIVGNDLDNTIANSGKNVTIQANGGDDSISNTGTITSVDAGAGDDSIINGYNENGKKDNVTLNAGDGDDYIYNHVDGDYTTLLGGAGNDTIENKGDTISIDAGDGDDSIFSYSFNGTISGGKGDDTITLSSDGKNNLIVYNEGDGDDIIYGFDAKSTLKIGDGTATYSSTVDGSDIIITVGENKITLVGAATLSTINIAASLAPIEVTSSFDNIQNSVLIIGNDEDNTIGNSGNNVTILANGGNDSISNSGSNSLIDAGKGDDTITLSSNGQNNLIVYNKGDGNDLIQGFNAKSSLSISGGYLSQKSGSDIIVTVRGSEITLKGAANLSTVNIIGDKYAPLNLKNYDDNVSMVGSQFDDTIENHGDNVTIVAREDDDYITNEALNTSILGGDGNDSVINVGSNITIDSGAGNDSIENYSKFSVIETGDGDDTIDNSQFGDNVAISSGAGNDSIESWGVNATISGGIGDDTINIAPTSDIALIQYTAGDGNDLITGFNGTSTLSISGGKYDLERTGADIIITVGDDKITLKSASTLSAPHIIGEPEKSKQYIENDQDGIVITGTELNDTIDNTGENVTILALEGDDSINNHGNANNALIDTADGNDTIRNDHAEYVTINAGAGNDSIRTNANRNVISAGDGNDTIKNEWALFNTIDAGAGDDSIYIDASTTVSAGLGNDTITLDSASDDEILITYMPGDGDDLIQGFNEGSTLSIGSDFFTSRINGDDVIVTVEEGNITLQGAAEVDPRHIVGTQLERGTYVTFTVEDSEVTYETDAPESVIKRSYKFNDKISLLTLNDKLKDYIVKVKNQEETSVKVNWHYGTASLSSASVLGYRLSGQKNNVTLTSKNYKDNITFSEDVNFKYDDITANILSGGGLSTQGENAISFDDDSSASVTAPEGSTIGINAGTFTVNDLPIKSDSGAGTITVEKDGLSFSGYGVQFVHLEIAKESYFEQVTPMTVAYNSNDESYSILNTACVKTLAADFTKLTFDISVSGDENYAYYKVNDVAFLVASDADNINVVEAKDSTFKIQGKEVDTKKISRVTIDERITFTGTEIDFNDVKTIYAQGKNVGYSLDGKEVTIDNAATVTTAGAETKTFNCAAGSYTVNGRTFETSAALTFTADTKEIKIPLSDAKTEIYFDGVTISGVSDGGELVFDLANQKIFVPNGAIVNVESSEAVKLNLVAGSFTVNDNAIFTGVGIEITADKDNIKVPLSENAVTINSAAITGTKDATIDKNKIITLPNGALVENVSENIFSLAEKNSAASFGNANKKVKLTEDGKAYIKYAYENGVSVGLNSVIFENVEILGNDAWTVETAGANGIAKITGITNGATISASTAEGADGDLNFDVETEGNGSFTICEQKFTSTGDAENIFTVSNVISDDTSTITVTAITKKLGTVNGNFEKGIQVNPESDMDKYIVKATNNDKDIEIALDTEGKLSVESIEGGANVEKYGQAEKVITVKNDKEYSLQIADYKYTVNGDLDDDGITFLLVDGDFKVRTLYENGLVTRYNVNDEEQLVWTWSIEQDKWIRESEQPIIEDAPYEITINTDKTLTLKANGVVINPYSNQVITNPKSGAAVDNAITVTARAIEGVTTFINNSASTPNIFVEDDQIITAFAPAANVTVDKTSYTLNSETATGTTFKLDITRKTLNIADGFNVVYNENITDKTDVRLENDNNDMYLSCYSNVTAPEGKNIEFGTEGFYTVNELQFRAQKGAKAQTIEEGVKLDLSTGTFRYDSSLILSGAGTAEVIKSNPKYVTLTDGAIVEPFGNNKFKHYNRRFWFSGKVELFGKKFDTNQGVRGGLIYFETSEAEWNDDGTYTDKTFVTTGFVIDSSYVEIQNDCYDSVKVVDRKITSVEGVKSGAVIAGNGTANISIVTTESGTFTIGGKKYKVSGDADGVTFVTDSNGNVTEVNGLTGTINGDFGNEISINGKAIQITGASSIKVASDGETITEISDVTSDLTTANDNTYHKEVRVYKVGGTEKLTTSTNGTINFDGKVFETNVGKTFNLDTSGNVLGIEKAQDDSANSSANVAETSDENFATITLSTTNNLDEITGDFSEGLTVNGVFVRVTDSTNFIVKDDAEHVYIETTAQDTFNINGKTFKTYADKTIFKLDEGGNVCEIVTDEFLPDEECYVIDGDFSDEIIFSGRKFHVTGTNKASLFIRNESIVCVDLAKNTVEVVESGGAADVVVKGEGEIIIGDKTFSTSSDFTGFLQVDSDGKVYSLDYFVGTISGELGGLELGIEKTTIDSEDAFSVTGSGGKISAIENLQNGSFACGNLNGLTINGAKVNVDNSGKVKVAVADGDLKISRLTSGAIASNSGGKVNFLTKENGEFFIGEDDFKVTGDNSVTFAADDNNKVQKISKLAENASVQTAYGGQFVVNNQTLTAKDEDIFVGLKNNSAKILGDGISTGEILDRFAGDKSTKIIDYVDAAGDTQKSGYVAHDESLNASTETTGLVIVAEEYSTVLGGKGSDTIYASAGSYIDAGAGKNYISLSGGGDAMIAMRSGKTTVANFTAGFDDDSDRVFFGVNDTVDFKFDGNDLKVYNNGSLRGVVSDVADGADFVNFLTADDNSAPKVAVAKEGAVITVEDEVADLYRGKKSGVDFTNCEENLSINLGSKNGSVGGGEVLFSGINRVTVGGGQNTLISSSYNETLTGNGTTEYIFAKDSGRDVIQNFNFDDDKINVGNETITAVNVNSSGAVRMQISGSAVLTLNDAQGKNFKINEFTALVDKNLTYNDEANYFVATSRNATLTVNEGAEIWLDGSHGKYFSGDIRTLDASTAQGKTSLVGNDSDNTVIAGNGDSSLWGGNGGDDLLVGGAGKNTFFYTNGNGSDTISGANNGDIVYLSQVNLEQIASTNIAADSLAINFKDGGSLQINSAAEVIYQLQDGSKFSANHEQAVWLTK